MYMLLTIMWPLLIRVLSSGVVEAIVETKLLPDMLLLV